MRRVASPVTVVTAGRGDEARGITIGSFTSASLDPPLITFNLSRRARMHSLLPRTDRFVVHVLGDD
ncbi:MAG: flavin reductase, partial [Rhodothermales bacterium]|nr:flavin reductase [Rhodothermales bacterium]